MLDVLAQKIGMDPLKLRLKNAAKAGTQMLSGAKLAHDGYAETIKALLDHPGYNAPLGKRVARLSFATNRYNRLAYLLGQGH